jgi:lipopolysaccharide/colanic/teichoic acid biosynthesis glycosyltransferase
LFNVVIGEMSLVGPRPEVPKYVSYYPADLRTKIFSIPPGITGKASIEFREENALLAQAADPEKEYIEKILPVKLAYYEEYVDTRSIAGDLAVIIRTIICLLK